MSFRSIFGFPFAVLYGFITDFRNLLFRMGIRRERRFETPIICVGNLSTGGTGKTPHVDYLIGLLKDKYLVATLSRGYKRKTRGFILADSQSTVHEIGDEPLQFHMRHPDALVAVDEKRVDGIKKLLAQQPPPDVIILDDAFQHRQVKAGLSILLTDYFSRYTKDFILPSGNLRESRKGAKRADIIVCTKSPKIFSPIERKSLVAEIPTKSNQRLFFSYIDHSDFTPMYANTPPMPFKDITTILCFSGIANPTPLEEYLKRRCTELIPVRFPDHYQYSLKNIQELLKNFDNIVRKNRIIVTTEKDAMRLKGIEFEKTFEHYPIYFISIGVDFHKADKPLFDQTILDYVG
ncbi:MAG: tetraacyldisaccharide 4'-kinase, partial [Bacteroidota bacterium]